MTEALDGFNGTVKAGGRSISNLRFADGIDLIAGNENDLRELTERLDKTSYDMEWKLVRGKAKFM